MSYNEQYRNVKSIFPELDLVKDSEFNLFDNSVFAQHAIEFCIQLCENASKKLNLNLHFGVKYSHTFNACAKIKNGVAVIIFNMGLINKLEAITSDSVEIFIQENIAGLTVESNSKDNLKIIVKNCCLMYLFYHELAHVLQLLEINSKTEFSLQEEYYIKEYFEIINHIYEIDADNFGSAMSGHLLLESIMNSDYKFETMVLFNTLTLLLFSIANIMIEFSGNQFQDIYYKENSHPHPFIRIVKCLDQILSFISKNLNTPSMLLETILQRTGNMINRIVYSDGRRVDYLLLLSQNIDYISDYIDEIESFDQNHSELTKHKTQQIFILLIY
nr:hypothetical protein [uncultured Flavobacterium sp.]